MHTPLGCQELQSLPEKPSPVACAGRRREVSSACSNAKQCRKELDCFENAWALK